MQVFFKGSASIACLGYLVLSFRCQLLGDFGEALPGSTHGRY